MLEAIDIAYAYPGRQPALTKVSARFSQGLTLLVGPNGSGKSTLLRLLAGLFRKNTGSLRWHDGREADERELRERTRLVIQDADAQLLGSTVVEDVMLGKAASRFAGNFDSFAYAMAERFNLADLWNNPIETLSFGEKRKLCLLNAMAAGPDVLLLDEPFESLDYPSARELRAFIEENEKNGVAQIISTHNLDPVIDLASQMVVIKDKTVAGQGKPAELLHKLESWSVRAPGKKWA